MQLIKITPDRVQIKSDNYQLGKLSINSIVKLSDGGERPVTIICMVTAITRNEDTERFDMDGSILEPETASVIECSIIGSLENGMFAKSIDRYPTSNDVKIKEVSTEEFEKMIVNDNKSSIKLGKYANYDCDAFVDGNKLLQRHFAILGSTGSGKSYTVAAILEKLSQMPLTNIIVFDIHGEYSSLSYAKKIKIGNDEGSLAFPMWFLPFKDLVSNLLKIKEEVSLTQIAALRNAFYKARKSNTPDNIPISYSFEDLITYLQILDCEEVETGEFYKTGDRAGMAKTVKGELNGKLSPTITLLKDKMIDSKYAFMLRSDGNRQSYLKQFVNEVYGNTHNGIKVVDLSDVPSDIVPTIIAVTANLLYRVQRMQERDAICPLGFVCDEAHVYIPSSDFSLGASQRRLLEIFETIAKEGRKFGVTLIPVSQRPSEVNKTILAQCANFITLKMSNDIDKQFVKGVLPEGTRDIVDSLSLFKPGDAIVIGDAASITCKMHIDKPSEPPISNTINTYDVWSGKEKHVSAFTANELVDKLLES